MKTINTKLILSISALLLTSACGVVPSAYRGQFVDASSGAKMELSGSGGVLQTADGRKLETKAKDLTVDELVKGEPGIYLSVEADTKNMYEVYWISPVPASRKEESKFLWYDAEILYSQIDASVEDDVATISFYHCKDGRVMVDLPTQKWQVGCPAGPLYYEMKRVKK